MITNHTWAGTATALSSITHGSETRALATMLRRETVLLPDCTPVAIPLISGNSLRGKLRRTAEEILGEVMGYHGRLTIAAAAALRSGGALTKTSRTPISGQKLARLRELVPLIGVFGTAGAGRIIDGCLQVGKLMPLCNETAHLLPHSSPLPAVELTQIETFSRGDDSGSHGSDHTEITASQLQYKVETFRAGTRFDVWLNLTNPTELEAAFFAAVLTSFAEHATVAGRAGTGHGRLRFEFTKAPQPNGCDWRSAVAANAEEAIELLNEL